MIDDKAILDLTKYEILNKKCKIWYQREITMLPEDIAPGNTFVGIVTDFQFNSVQHVINYVKAASEDKNATAYSRFAHLYLDILLNLGEAYINSLYTSMLDYLKEMKVPIQHNPPKWTVILPALNSIHLEYVDLLTVK